jgi:hypothetical protein
MEKKLDFKYIFILILSAIIIFMLIFYNSPKKEFTVDKELKKQNTLLQHLNDSLMLLNQTYDARITILIYKADSIENKLIQSEKRIKELNKKKNEIPKIVNAMSANDVANTFSDIIAKSKR